MSERFAVRDLFVDTSVLLPALIDFGARSAAALALFDVIVAGREPRKPKTAWHCCLETYSVATRLPEEFRLRPSEIATLIEEEVIRRFEVVDLPPLMRLEFLRDSARAGVRGGRVYDAHIVAAARAARAKLIVTDNRRDFAGLAGEGVRVADASGSLKLVERAGRERA